MQDGFPKVAGCCPMGCGETLFLGHGGHVTCSWHRCPDPMAVDGILDDRETEHVVTFTEEHFTVRHPLRERLGDMASCSLHRWIAALPGPPVMPGVYRARRDGYAWSFEPLAEAPA
jgi:hypothetical protein